MGADNRQFDAMFRAASARLLGRSPEEIARRTGIAWDAGARRLAFSSFGRPFRLAWPDLRDPGIQEGDMWHFLTVLQYLDSATDALPSGQFISLSALPGGLARGASFDAQVDAVVRERLGKLEPTELEARLARMGAVTRADARADLCADAPFMPRYPMRLQMWYADDEFPASGKVLVDAGVRDSLGLEAAGTMAVQLARMLADDRP